MEGAAEKGDGRERKVSPSPTPLKGEHECSESTHKCAHFLTSGIIVDSGKDCVRKKNQKREGEIHFLRNGKWTLVAFLRSAKNEVPPLGGAWSGVNPVREDY